MTPPRREHQSPHTNPRRRREEYVRIPRSQTAELRMIRGLRELRPQPLVFYCPSCPDPANSRLVMILLSPKTRVLPRQILVPRRRPEPIKMLLHLTLQQVDDIRAEFDRPPKGSTARP
jgi:hypothetical protein